ncbi:MAG: GNAT family N-acetyltransferase [Roseburia sp.]|nr:GNAT family N-acetyltransferase [Anaeroplasma bactoclasticum]MCM1196461.1 GNAT family N-acetyltransferase [Roseburia sp.]MCM1557204.1 GNAT family N-acetyltransferase [Anaeroplasma bactoclasticum]
MIEIRKYQEKDNDAVRQICMETAKAGYQSKEVVCWMFLDYYLESESKHAYVLVDENAVVGYIVASTNSKLYEKQMKEKWIPKIWKYSIFLGIFSKLCLRAAMPLDKAYGGGFHMNITPKYQKLGLGKRLLDVMTRHLSLCGNSYLYLITENKKTRGYGFYKHYGFKEVKKYLTGSLALVYNLKMK